MAKPVIDSGDITTSTGTGTTGAITTPAYENGDLLIAFIGIDDDLTANNPSAPSTGPFGETLILSSVGSGGSTGGGPTQGVVAWLGTATRAADTIDFTWTGSEFWAGRVIKVLAGEFDGTTPLGTTSGYDGNTSDSGTTVSTPSWSIGASDGGGAIVVHMVADADAISGAPSGWAITDNVDHGGLATAITQRTAESVDSETIASVDYTVAADSSSTKGVVVRPLSAAVITSVDSDYGAASDEFDVDENSLDVNGTLFEAVQGTGTVWLADETTLAASTAEVDLDAAINTWGDTEVNLNLNNLSAGDKTNVEALIVSDGHALFIILVNDSGDETSLPVTVHRAKAFAMSLSANIAASGENTTGQLTAPAVGTFGGGRIQDDENPADTVDIGTDQFFEDEWCIEALTASVYDETYQFRVLINGQPADTITVTPGLTVETGGGTPITGTIAIVGALTAALTGVGVLAASIPAAFTLTADLKGKGVLSSTIPAIFTVTGAPRAVGVISSTIAITSALTADLKGKGVLASTIANAFTLTGALTGIGTLATSIPAVFTVTPDLKGVGVLSSTIPGVFTITGTVTAAVNNAITSSISIAFTVAADLKGKGVLSSTIPAILTVTTDLTGIGSLSSTIPAVFTLTADLEGEGVLSSTIPIVFTVTPDLKGVGVLSSTLPGVFTLAGALTVAGSNAITSTIPITFTLTPDLKGKGVLTSAIPAVLTVTPDLKGVGSLSSTIASVFTLTPDLKGVGVLSSTIPAVFTLTADLEGEGVLSSTISITFALTADLKGVGVLSSTIPGVFTVTPDLKGIGVLSSTIPGVFTITGNVTAATNNAITGSISITSTLTADLKGKGVLTSAIANVFTITSNLTGIGSISSSIPAVFTVTAAPRAVGVLTSTIPAVFTLTGLVTADNVTSSISITFSLAGALTGIGQISGSIPFAFTLTGDVLEEQIFEWKEVCPDPSDFSNVIDATDTWSAVAKDTSTWDEIDPDPINTRRCA